MLLTTETVDAISPLLQSACAASLAMLSVRLWKSKHFAGHRVIALSFLFGAYYFLINIQSVDLGFFENFVYFGPWLSHLAIRHAIEAKPRPVWLEALMASILFIVGFVGFEIGHWPWVGSLFNILALYLFIEAPILVLIALADDLVLKRRRVKFWVLGAYGLLGLTIALMSVFNHRLLAHIIGPVIALVITFVWATFGTVFQDRSDEAQPMSEVLGKSVKTLTQTEVKIAAKLQKIMETELYYQDPQTSLSRLAQKLGQAEHIVRKIIHVSYGDKNFSAYLNRLRLGSVIQSFENVQADSETLISLAYGVGYNSLSAFNRAFQSHYNTTPSAYRAALKAARTEKHSATIVNSDDNPNDNTEA